MADRTEELAERIRALDAAHNDWLRRLQCWMGRVFKTACRFSVMRVLISGPLSRLAAYLIVERGVCGVVGGRKTDVLDVAENWLKTPTFLRMPCRVAYAGDDRVLVEWDECAVGFSDPSCLKACRCACEIDAATVRRLGGRLVVTENVLEGAPRCIFEITLERPERR